jgi:hypothetical protein
METGYHIPAHEESFFEARSTQRVMMITSHRHCFPANRSISWHLLFPAQHKIQQCPKQGKYQYHQQPYELVVTREFAPQDVKQCQNARYAAEQDNEDH